MKINSLIIITIFVVFATASRQNVTDFYSGFLDYDLTYQAWSGYEDVDWYISSSEASVYYSLWECSRKTFADHSVPLIFWIQGGPGTSSQFAAFKEIGPLGIDKIDKEYKASENPFSWNYFSHLVFVDQPVGTGLSYNKGSTVSDTKTATKHFLNFLYNFFRNTPWGLKSNPVYLAGEGYAGHFIPSFAEALKNNGSLGINLSGILLGGGYVDPEVQSNYFDSFLYATGIVSKKWRDTTHYMQNQGIIAYRNEEMKKFWGNSNFILSSKTASSHYGGMNVNNYKIYGNQAGSSSAYNSFLNEYKSKIGVPSFVKFSQNNQLIFDAFAVDSAGSFRETLDELLTKKVKVLIFNGQNDFIVNTIGVLNYLQNMTWKGMRQWRKSEKEIWRQSGKNFGWVKKYQNLILVMIRGAGHYIYENDINSAKASWSMATYYFDGKW